MGGKAKGAKCRVVVRGEDSLGNRVGGAVVTVWCGWVLDVRGHFVRHVTVRSPCCAPEADVTLPVNSTWKRNLKKSCHSLQQRLGFFGPLFQSFFLALLMSN